MTTLRLLKLGRSEAGEFFGTFLLVLFGLGAVVQTTLQYSTVSPPVVFALVLMPLVIAFGAATGGHFNAAVTVALAYRGEHPWGRVPSYIISQIAGAAAATGVLEAEYGHEAVQGSMLSLQHGAGALKGLLFELLGTAVLGFVVGAVTHRLPNTKLGQAIGIGIGLYLAISVAGNVSGGGVNPSRALGPMLVVGQFNAWGVYIFAPIIGAVVGMFLFDQLFAEAQKPETDES